jgi:putative modified peptide
MSYQLPEPVVDRLLDRLGNDDDFRRLFTADTRAALASIGFAPAADRSVQHGAWFCLAVESLASKEAIRAGRNQLRLQFTTNFIPLMPFALEATERVQGHAA